MNTDIQTQKKSNLLNSCMDIILGIFISHCTEPGRVPCMMEKVNEMGWAWREPSRSLISLPKGLQWH